MLTVDQLEPSAMEHNPTLVEASAPVGMPGNWLQQGLYPNPRIAYKADEMGDEGKTGFQGASLAQELVTHKKLALARCMPTSAPSRRRLHRAAVSSAK